ncbi:unnamed protein product [Parascedosporium putredinis]|uniref:Methyltransferase domain-containing protein n=1 Tax=Parascedosporium putredinis TaxID=1442378 RepID=A0A9P1MAW7_9PEZI|nr:unnamed protein product [Parascedosporium putredinis]CAI7993513.1 unnamed protein product [Parascedosporium putredinis]
MPKHLPIEVDPDIIAAASDYDGSSAASSFTSSASLRSSILRYRVENGRTYHAYKDGSYLGPNDDPEKERLELQHTLCVLTFDELYLCPAGKPDPAPYVPANVEFGIDDLEDPWTYSDRFSLIYARFLTASVADWPRLFKQCYDNLEPGGWLEVVDILPITSDDGTLAADTPLARWAALILEGTRRWPKDSKLKELGQWCFENIDTGLEAISNAIFTRFLGWTKEDLDAFLAEVREDMKNHDIHSYWPM